MDPAAVKAAQKARIAKTNEETAKYFAAAFGGLLALFILLHWGRLVSLRRGLRFNGAVKVAVWPIRHVVFRVCDFASRTPILILRRVARIWTIRSSPVLISMGQVLMVVTYVAICIILAFTNTPGLPYSSPRNWLEKRFGWYVECVGVGGIN